MSTHYAIEFLRAFLFFVCAIVGVVCLYWLLTRRK
jgi:hypothetical protein